MTWTDDEWEIAKAMAAQGNTAREIGDAIGKTRNAVIGALWRARGKGEPMVKTVWTPEQISLMREMAAAGNPARLIGVAVGLSAVTVYSKASKLGIHFKGNDRMSRRMRDSLDPAAIVRKRKQRGQVRNGSPPLRPIRSRTICTVPLPEGRTTFATRRPGECNFPCWPHDLPMRGANVAALRVCGDPVDGEGSPYCTAHRMVCYQPPRERRAA